MSDLAAFVAARLDDDESTAEAAYCYGPNPTQPTAPPEGSWWTSAQLIGALGPGTFNDACHIVRHDPGRVLREVAAKRAILAEYKAVRKLQGLTDTEPDGYRDWILSHLATAWNDHPDYRAEWKP